MVKENGISLEPGDEIIMEVTARKNEESEKPRLIVEKIHQLDRATEIFSDEIYLHVFEKDLQPDTLPRLAALCRAKRVPKDSKGAKLMICVVTADDRTVFVESNFDQVLVDAAMLREVEKLLGVRRFQIKACEVAPPPRQWTRPPAEKEA
jgi:hypothetical protein